jgi:dynein heavy chain 1
MSPPSPRDYIRLACELHLGVGNLADEAPLESFLNKDGVSGIPETSTRLFVWLPHGAQTLQASTQALPKQGRVPQGALVFLATAASSDNGAVTLASQIQCMTLWNPTDEGTTTSESEGEEDKDDQASSLSSPAAVLQSLQLYTRQCFMPTVQSVLEPDEWTTSLQDKIRQLDVALSQTSRSARLPHVVLNTHEVLVQAASRKTGDKMDLEALGLANYLQDDEFLNSLQATVNGWIVQIRKITTLPKSTPFLPDAAAEELTFWTQLQAELLHIQTELSSAPVELTVALLREAKRFVVVLALENNSGLEQALSYTQDVAHFIKPYPLPSLQAARSVEGVVEAVQSLFDHYGKLRQSRFYGLPRAIELLQATTLVLRDTLLAILQEQFSNLLFMDYKEYENKVRFSFLDVFVQFDDRFEEWKDFILEQGRRRKVTGLNKLIEGMSIHHLQLKDRLETIHQFRSSQERLRDVVHKVLREEEPAAMQQVESVPRQIFASLNVLDLTPSGTKALESALEEYDLQMDAMEERLAKLLRDKLTACQDAEDMFRVFARFNLLLTRRRVRASVKEFQIQLIATVALAVEKLQSKFTLKYESSAAARISRLRGIPPVAGKILWAKQMERQVQTLMERMGDVLGPDWGQQLEGRQLRKSGDELLSKLDARSFFHGWVTEWEKGLSSAAASKMNSYPIIVEPEGRDGVLTAKVNFDEKSELLFKEIRHLKWLGFGKEIPRTLSMVSDEAMSRYPYAIAVKTALRSYKSVRILVTPELERLVMPQLLEIRETISEAFDVKLSNSKVAKKRRVRWEGKEISEWVAQLTTSISKFEDRVEQLLRACDKVDIALNLLEEVDYNTDKFRAVLASIQKTIDDMSLSGYNDLDSWVRVISSEMGKVLSKRLEFALKGWNQTLQVTKESNNEDHVELIETAVVEDIPFPESITTKVSLEIVLRNQEISAVPALPMARAMFLNKLHEYFSVVCSLPRPKSGRYEVFDSVAVKNSQTSTGLEETFDNLVYLLPPKLVADAYGAIEAHIRQASVFVESWLAYQTLWDTQVSDVASSVGSDIEKWQALLLEASEARATLDTSATVAEFGPILVDYGKVQSQINLKYDSWQKELQSNFASILAQRISETREKIDGAKTRLEETTLTNASTESIVLGVTFIQEINQKSQLWRKDVDILHSCERLLKRQRYAFHSEWVETTVVKGLYDSLLQILERRTRTMEQQVPLLQTRVSAEDKKSTKELAGLIGTWNQDKPLRGNVTPPQAIEVLSKFEINLTKAHVHQENLGRAKDALGLEHTTESHEVVESLKELTDLKEVWDAMMEPYRSLEEIKDTLWSTAVMRKIRRALDDILASMRSLPNRIRQYDAYTQLHAVVKGYIEGHSLLSDLKSEALKERHWKTIFQRLGIRVPFIDLTVGILWENGILTRKKDVSEILTVAQGEMALEVFLSEVRDRWLKQELELVLFQNRTRLIRGWDDLFATLDDHIGGLALMKSSPYYRAVREFQEEGKLWEDRLTQLRAAFDAWVDVQRRWVYLEGILFGSSDIKAQLPAEWSRFKSVDSEFVSLMRRIVSKPFAMEVLNIDNLQRTLERLGNLMTVIQKALGEYLAKQRSDFSRFYFLGDDDLLEIMGNSGEPGKVLAHIGKMFAGIVGARRASGDVPENVKTRFDAMVSKDGEIVELHKPIDITAETTVKGWLKELEISMQTTLALLLQQAVGEDVYSTSAQLDEDTEVSFVGWSTKFPAQVMILAAQINWSMGVDSALGTTEPNAALADVLRVLEWKLEVMANTVLEELPADSRKKFEQLITELVRQRDVVRQLMKDSVSDPMDFRWLYHLRYNYDPKAEKVTEKLSVSLSNAKFYYGFEYLGIGERLVQTPLTDKCYLTLTQALHFRMGGSPFGPAGTGKTESVKALGAALGRFVLVFNCDETFDFSAMGRLLAGLSQVGAWGCFDEFNRLEERILSAVSQQILTIQRGLLERKSQIELLGRPVSLHNNVGIFITMNPGYEGRSNLPDNLKNLFRSFAMVVPDRKLIAQVMLYSQGIVTAEHLAGKIVDLFMLCDCRLSKQRHYDFGLRALKTLLVSAGALKRQAIEGRNLHGEDLALAEKNALIVGACNNVLPKLVAEDMVVFKEVLESTFPGSDVAKMEDTKAREEIVSVCKRSCFVPGEGFLQKILQLKQVIEMRHGVMVVGPVGVGKSTALKVLLEVLEKLDGTKGEMSIIDPKAISKERLYGSLDGTTLEWTDGVFTSLLRRIVDNQKGESDRRHWIVFDGDVDPNWVENLNSVLDDNKMLTLPSGERLSIPDNVRIILEVDSLAHATPATVSRCGMVWFSDDNVTNEMSLQHMLQRLATEDLMGDRVAGQQVPSAQIEFLNEITGQVISERTSSLVIDALEFALKQRHIMEPTSDRLLHTFRALLIQGIVLAIEYDENHPDFPITGEHMEKFAKRWLLHSLMWSFCGSASWDVRKSFSDMLLRTSGIIIPFGTDNTLYDYRVRVDDGEYELWSDNVPRMEIESHRAAASDVVITTTDTVRHSDVLGAWLTRRIPLILCGPPGSGKTMTLVNVLQSIQGVILANLNFSSRTTPEIILKTFSQYCSYVRRGKDIFLEPGESFGATSWLVVFADEVNLPEEDNYGTQRVIMFMRQLVEHGGFWRNDNVWVKTNRIQFVGACNPPTDAGRVEMSRRFMRHVPLLLVDFPAKDSLMQIYRTFNGGMMKLFPNLKGETEAMTEAMVELYTENQRKFTPAMQPQYFYSPRELSRWVRAIYESVVNSDQGLTREELVRVWTHEGLRLFADRLVDVEDKEWCSSKLDEVARKWFAGVDFEIALARPMFYTTWLSKDTRRVERGELKDFLSARLRVFYEEELDVPLVVFDEVLEHVLRIDRVLRQPMGHLLLVGDSGAGKTVLSKFVSWMNGLSIFQIKAHSRYGMEDFNEDLRGVMRRVGVDGERVCFIFDESNVLSSGFIEAINALLASGEIPGLFDGDDYTALMSAVRDTAARDGVILDSDEELWRHFTSIVQRNLHVVFTVNPSGGDWKNRSTTSPALFNRCVVDWFGTWGSKAMGEVGREFTTRLDMGDSETEGGAWGIGEGEELMKRVEDAFDDNSTGGLRQAVVAALVNMHQIAREMAEEIASSPSSITRTFLSPRDYLALIQNFVSCFNERREKVEDEQLHVNAGLSKLKQTQENVAELKQGLGTKTAELRKKETLANEKLQQMVADQNIAEKRKEEAERMSVEVEKQQKQINERKDRAQKDLDEAEPALRSAQASVRGIKKRDLDEIRNLSRPPNNVKLTLECVAIMLGETSVDWTDVRKLLAKADFIPSILNFDVDNLSAKQIKLVKEKYLDGNSELNEESVLRSSKACGPLYKWAESQIKYSTIYNNIQPLREEVAQLEEEADIIKTEKYKIEDEVKELEASIASYKADYASLIRDVEALKSEMEAVTMKIDRAESLMTSLSHESERWSKSSETFQTIMRSLVGDGLLMAATLTYQGFFDFKVRSMMMSRWKKSLECLDIEFREELGIVESLSTGAQRLTWQAQGLPGDQLSLENGVILDHGIRFPLVIDPSGNAIDFLMNKHKDEKIQTTSFLDKSFTKTLAGAVRFGTTLLVENVERIDPILNPILNKEIQRTGGRTLVRIGTEEVDYSPQFKIILSTKNPGVQLTPDLCSRVTLVNFTVTPDSLQSQSLSHLVKSLRPELEEQRATLLKLQSEQNVKLRELEDQMLAKISACEGSILDDDRVVEGMEILMKEGSQVEEQISHSAEVMKQVHQAVARFEPFAAVCRKMFVLLEALRELSFLYEFPAKAFMTILEHILEHESASREADEAARIGALKMALFRETAARIGRSLQVDDKLVFSILLARFYQNDETMGSAQSESSEDLIAVITGVFGEDFPWQGRALNDLNEVTESEINSTVPLLLCSAPGHDVSGRVEAMARDLGKELFSVAMGSTEGYATAESMVAMASKRGTWVMLKNVHLCIEWLRDSFVKRLQTLGSQTHKDFRIFITSEMNDRLPAALLQISDLMVAEAPTGVKASLTRFFSSLSKDRLGSSSMIHNRMYLLLGWTHAVIQERLRYVPNGWTERYEFTEADAWHGLDVIDSLVSTSGSLDESNNRTPSDPEHLPWDAIRSTLCKGVFGGRVTSEVDQRVLDELVHAVFVPASFNVDFRLVEGSTTSPTLPDGSRREDILSWIASLPTHTPPAWIGLDRSAEEEREQRVVQSVQDKVSKMQVQCESDNE